MRLRTTVLLCLVALFAALIPSLPATATPPAPEYALDRAIVGAKSNGKVKAEGSIRAHGGEVVSYSEEGNFFVVETPADAKDWSGKVKGAEAVRYAEPDYELTADVLASDPLWSQLWGMTTIGMPAAWDLDTGSDSVVVGVIDTGVDYNHEDLATQMWTNPDEIAGNGLDDDGSGFVDDIRGADCRNNDGNPMDDENHGTHVSGTIGGAANNGTGVAGINWDVSIMALKFLGSTGSGYTSDAVECLYYAIAQGAHLTSNSWGGSGYSQSLYDAILAARNANQLFIAAAGNSAVNTDSSAHYPSSYNLPNVVSVAASTSSDSLASFSNYGSSSVDLAAPGVGIVSTVRNNSYASYNGTSMATPHVAGAAALLMSEYPALKNDHAALKARILGNVDLVSALSGKVLSGGRLNVAKAITPPTPPAVPTGLAVATASSTQLDLTWSDVATESNYRIERSSDGLTGWATAGTNPQNDVTFSDTGRDPSTTYFYRVVATNLGGEAISDVASGTTAAPPPPAPETPSLTASTLSATQIDLAWTDSTSETGYKLERSSDGNTWSQLALLGQDVLTHTDSALQPSRTYYYRVSASNAGGSSTSNVASATTAPDLSAPTAFSLTATGGSRRVTLNWTGSSDPESGITGYEVYRAGSQTGTYSRIATLSSSARSYSNTGLRRSRTYWYYVLARNGAGLTTQTTKVSARTF